MATTTLTVAAITPPPPGKQRGYIVGTTGAKIGCFAEKFGLFEVGQTYDIDVTDGQYQNVKAAILIVQNRAAPQAAAPLRAVPAARSVATPPSIPAISGETNRQTHPTDAERMWVCSILNAAIQAGRVHMDEKELFAATVMLRRLWAATFAMPGTAYAGEAMPRQARG